MKPYSRNTKKAGIAFSIAILTVSIILGNGDMLYQNKAVAQVDNSTVIQEFNGKLDQIQTKFREFVEQNKINTTSLTLPNSSSISEDLQKLNSTKILEEVSNAFNKALSEAGITNTTEGMKDKYGGDLSKLVQKFEEIKGNSTN
jgi:predicted transcriptional regulator